MKLLCSPFAAGELFDWMWGCCAGTHASSTWQNNGNDCYAVPGTDMVAPVNGRVVRAGVPALGQGQRVGIQAADGAVYMAHMTNLRVREGQDVMAGNPVGEIWDFPGVPSHLHFSMARGSYGDSGGFIDPKSELLRTAELVSGRTYRASGLDLRHDRPSPRPVADYFLEELPFHMHSDGFGPRVLGPWQDTTPARKRRDDALTAMEKNGLLAAPMNMDGKLYIYHYRPNTYGLPLRRGPWDTLAKQKNAREKLERALGRPLRPFKGLVNSLYPSN